MPIFFDNKKTASKYMMQVLEQKYQREFQIVENEKYKRLGLCDYYSCTTQPKDNEKQPFFARVMAYGELIDNFAVYQYKEEIEKEARGLLDGICTVSQSEVECMLPATNVQWKGCPLEEFVQRSGVRNRITIDVKKDSLQRMKKDSTEIIDKCKKLKVDTELVIICENQLQLYRTISARHQKERMTHEQM